MNKNIQGDFQICISVPITDFLYSEHLFTRNTFLRNAWNDCPNLIAKSLYSAHFITDLSMADIIFKSKFTLLPKTDLSIADTLNNRLCNTFLVRNVHIFYFKQCFTVFYGFSLIFVILFFSQFDTQFQVHKNKNLRGFPVLMHLHGWPGY